VVVDLKEYSIPGHIQKARRNIRELLKAVDLILELVDSRIPYTGRAYEEEALFLNKPRIIVFSKTDLADEKALNLWKEFYARNEKIPFIDVSLKEIDSVKKLKKFITDVLKGIRVKFKDKRIMVAGIPNVGKSSLINALAGKKIAKIGNEPGITRGIQWISIGKEIKLLDTPGILYKKVDHPLIYKKLCLVGSIKNFEDLDEILDFGFDLLMNRYRNILADYASIGEKEIEDLQYQQFLEKFAEKRRFLKKGGILDLERAKQTFMKDLVDGKIGRVIYELPEDVIG
jgi:ribosome biogenesis GTPase A